jgi:hypothetical protein
MKTDPFEEAIRRKLESVEPVFQEKNWAQMQSFMRQHGYPPAWQGVGQWLVPAASSLVMVGLLVANIWQYRTNQQLHQTVQTLQQAVARLEKAHAPAPASQPANGPAERAREVASAAEAENKQYKRSARGEVGFNEKWREPDETAASSLPHVHPEGERTRERPVGESARRSVAPARMEAERRAQSVASTYPVRRSPIAGNVTEEQVSATDRVVAERVPQTDSPAIPNEGGGLRQRRATNDGPLVGSVPAGSGMVAEKRLRSGGRYETPSASGGTVSQPAEGVAVAIPLTPLRPTPIARDSVYFPDWMARRARKIRSLLPPTPWEPVQSAEIRPTGAGLSTGRIRVGVNGELALRQSAVGLYADVRVGRNWLVGVGLNYLRVSGGRFLTDDDYRQEMRRDFRHEYAFGIDPRIEIFNIDRQSYAWQVPVSLGYQLPLGGGLLLTPSVGATFSLTAREQTTFNYRRGPRELLGAENQIDRPTQWYNNYTLGLAVEKQWRRWAVQAGPFVTGPFEPTPDRLNLPTVGLRSRVLVRF